VRQRAPDTEQPDWPDGGGNRKPKHDSTEQQLHDASFWANKNKNPAPPVWWAGLVNRQQASSTRQIVGLLNALILLLGDEHMHEKSVIWNMQRNIRDFVGVVKSSAIAQSNRL
jgi:hypothetical protein